MKITIIGTGYVGLVTGVGLSELGHTVYCVDTDEEKIKLLEHGKEPFFEPDLGRLLKKNIKAKRLFFTKSLKDVLNKTSFVFICVGTPQKRNGSADLSYLFEAAEQIKKLSIGGKIIIIKSTVPVATGDKMESILNESNNAHFEVASCPEFLREGRAIYDFFNPDRIVVGSKKYSLCLRILNLFAKIKTHKISVSRETAELIKYASNAYLAAKISFINEIGNICEHVGANVDDVANGMGLDKRINPHFLKAGIGYGGSCFPKDVKALKYLSSDGGYNFRLLRAVIEVNNKQRKLFFNKIKNHFGDLRNKKVALLGLSFKDNTDDIRESAAIDIANNLIKHGAKLYCHDPRAMENAKKVLKKKVEYSACAYDIMDGAEALVIATEWPQFSALDWKRIKKLMKYPIIFDGKNILDKQLLIRLGFKIINMGK